VSFDLNLSMYEWICVRSAHAKIGLMLGFNVYSMMIASRVQGIVLAILLLLITCSARVAQGDVTSVFGQPFNNHAIGPAKALLHSVLSTTAMSTKLFRIVLEIEICIC